MLDEAQALAYARADFEDAHRRIIEDFCRTFPDQPATGRLLDLGCGPGDITLRLARANPGWQVEGVDGSPAMLRLARAALAVEPTLRGRVCFTEACLPDDRFAPPRFDAVFSNSLLHHLAEPAVLWETIRGVAHPGAGIYVADLLRPANAGAARDLVDRYAADEPAVLRHDFHRSLLAAFRVDEVREQLAAAGLSSLEVRALSDRHLAVSGRLPAIAGPCA
ncbi:MAG: methyltransferase domain-containing protein [Verrucomicrobiales bacterium]|nr:methyltransferase domain-containing protein [Verrucomicrobiales bacterium]MCP5526180.1 methyltransferase domain-containing protein [Verrucomicrobiales bacterium]